MPVLLYALLIGGTVLLVRRSQRTARAGTTRPPQTPDQPTPGEPPIPEEFPVTFSAGVSEQPFADPVIFLVSDDPRVQVQGFPIQHEADVRVSRLPVRVTIHVPVASGINVPTTVIEGSGVTRVSGVAGQSRTFVFDVNEFSFNGPAALVNATKFPVNRPLKVFILPAS